MQNSLFSHRMLIMAFLATIILLTATWSQTGESLQPGDYGAVALIVKHELSSLDGKLGRPICVHISPYKKVPKSLLTYLRRQNGVVRDSKSCYPEGQLPLGSEIRIWEIKRGTPNELALKVETGNLTPESGAHVGDLLRLGTYRVKKGDKGEWSVENYEDEKPKN